MYSLGAVPLYSVVHMAENISKKLGAVLTNTLKCSDVSPVVTTDGAANMKAAIRATNGWFWIRCVCHSVHLAVTEACNALDEEVNILSKVK